jgi:hypothetical protein
MTTTGAEPQDGSLTRTAVGLAVATVLVWLVLAALDHDGAGWLIWAILGVATAVTAWRAGGTSPKNTRPFVALIIGVLAILVFLGFVIAG